MGVGVNKVVPGAEAKLVVAAVEAPKGLGAGVELPNGVLNGAGAIAKIN